MIDNVVGWVLGLFVVAVMIICVVVMTMCMISDGKVDYCYTSVESFPQGPQTYTLTGHVSWRPDRLLASRLSSFDDAQTFAKKFGCEIH